MNVRSGRLYNVLVCIHKFIDGRHQIENIFLKKKNVFIIIIITG